MAHEKQYTPKQAAFAVLEKVGELLKKSELLKAEALEKAEPSWKKPEQNADQHVEGKEPKGEIHPKETEQAPSAHVETQQDPQHNPKEQAEGNNELAGTTPTQVGQDGKNKPGYDEMKGHLKLAKFIGRMEHKRLSKMGM